VSLCYISQFKHSMASVQMLPSEILSTIFRLTLGRPSLRLRAVELLAQHRARVYTLIKLSLVCREWRSIVLGDGTLWTTLPVDASRTDCQQSITIVLERSKQAMLDVSMVCDDDLDRPHEALLSEISKNIARIKSLHLHATSPKTLRNLSVPAPKLETLNILAAGQPTELGLLFGGNLPALRSLTLTGLPSWPLGLFSNLKDLRLVLPPSHPTVRVSSLIDVMSRSPGIEEIKMTAFLSIIDDSPPSSVAHLPNLRKFTMRDCDSATVFSHTAISATADIKVIMDHRRMRDTMGIPSHGCHILRSAPEDMSTMGFLAESTMFVLQQSREIKFGMGFYRSRSSRPSFRVLDRSTSVDLFARQSLEALATNPQYFRNIKDLSIALSACTAVSWSAVLRGFKQLERLSMIALHVPSVLSTLMVTDEDDLPICPSLKRVDVRERCNGRAVVLDGDDMVDFFVARKILNCAAVEVNIHGSGGRKWKCGSSGDRIVVGC